MSERYRPKWRDHFSMHLVDAALMVATKPVREAVRTGARSELYDLLVSPPETVQINLGWKRDRDE